MSDPSDFPEDSSLPAERTWPAELPQASAGDLPPEVRQALIELASQPDAPAPTNLADQSGLEDKVTDQTILRGIEDPVEETSLASEFQVLTERLPAALGVDAAVVSGIVDHLIENLPESWATPQQGRVRLEPYSGNARDVQRLARADLAGATGDQGATIDLLRYSLLPTLRRLESEQATREDLCDIAVEVARVAPDSAELTEFIKQSAGYLIDESDPDRLTTNYYVTMVNLANSLPDHQRDAELTSAVLFDHVLKGVKRIQTEAEEPFDPSSTEARQVRIASHNLAATIMRVAQARRDQSPFTIDEPHRLEVLSAAHSRFDREPAPATLDDVVERFGLTSFAGQGDPEGPDTARAALRVLTSVGSIGKSSRDETIDDALAAAVSACCAYSWTDLPGSAAARYFNASVSLGRVIEAGGDSMRSRGARTTLLLLAVGCGFSSGDLETALLANDGLNIAAAFAVAARPMFRDEAELAKTAAMLARLAGQTGLTGAGAGALRGDAMRLTDAAQGVELSEDLGQVHLGSIVRQAAVAVETELIPPLAKAGLESWSPEWLAEATRRIFESIESHEVGAGLLRELPEWVAKASDSRELLMSYATDGWRSAEAWSAEAWSAPPVYSGIATDQEWEHLTGQLAGESESVATALARYLNTQV